MEKHRSIPPAKTIYIAYVSIERPIRKDVTVVPMLAPMTIPAACDRFIRPALTRPIVMAIDAELDCMMIVRTIPISTALMVVDVYLSM